MKTCVIFVISSTKSSSASLSMREVASFPLVLMGRTGRTLWRPFMCGQVFKDRALILIRCGIHTVHTIVWNTERNTASQLRSMSSADTDQEMVCRFKLLKRAPVFSHELL